MTETSVVSWVAELTYLKQEGAGATPHRVRWRVGWTTWQPPSSGEGEVTSYRGIATRWAH